MNATEDNVNAGMNIFNNKSTYYIYISTCNNI